jgi:hypothetical protein
MLNEGMGKLPLKIKMDLISFQSCFATKSHNLSNRSRLIFGEQMSGSLIGCYLLAEFSLLPWQLQMKQI